MLATSIFYPLKLGSYPLARDLGWDNQKEKWEREVKRERERERERETDLGCFRKGILELLSTNSTSILYCN